MTDGGTRRESEDRGPRQHSSFTNLPYDSVFTQSRAAIRPCDHEAGIVLLVPREVLCLYLLGQFSSSAMKIYGLT
jgi:hypothetical protein